MTKVCKKCKIEKKLTSFHRQKSSNDGFNSICKICINEYQKAHRPPKDPVLDRHQRLVNPTKKDWCEMFAALKKLGYDIYGDIHLQFIERHNIPTYKERPKRDLKRRSPLDCSECLEDTDPLPNE